MKLQIENIKLNGAIQILDKLSLKGLKSIHRTRLSKQLTEKLQRVAEEEKQLKKEHCNLDDDGEPIVIDGKLDIKDMDEFQEVMQEFYSEKVIIDSSDSLVMLKSVKKSLEESEIEWEGEEAYTFESLYSAFEEAEQDEN
jgi:hypothetical protein